MWNPPTLNGVHIAPGLSGGSEWSPLSYNPELKLAYVSAIDKQMQFCLVPHGIAQWFAPVPETARGCRDVANFEFFASLISPLNLEGVAVVSQGDPLPHVAFVAINVDNDQVVWEYTVTPHPISGTLATAGNLVFAVCQTTLGPGNPTTGRTFARVGPCLSSRFPNPDPSGGMKHRDIEAQRR
jgi:hypothetical protein